MRRVMLLALLALALPTAALANSITFANSKSSRLATGVYFRPQSACGGSSELRHNANYALEALVHLAMLQLSLYIHHTPVQIDLP